jgi:hypothetical protein
MLTRTLTVDQQRGCLDQVKTQVRVVPELADLQQRHPPSTVLGEVIVHAADGYRTLVSGEAGE